MSTFKNKVALVTGGGTGIGKNVTEALVAQGARVVITGRRAAPLEAVARQNPDQIRFLTADVSQSGEAKRVVTFVAETFGRLDILVNNAGVGIAKPLVETSDDEFDQMLSVNVKGPLMFTREAVPYLAKDGGTVVNISSVAGQTALPGFAAYAGTKAALDRVTRSLAAELGPMGIRVNVVAPGLTDTPMYQEVMGPQPDAIEQMVAQTALRRVGQTEDVTQSILWLASDNAAWVTGQIVQASGGLLL